MVVSNHANVFLTNSPVLMLETLCAHTFYEILSKLKNLPRACNRSSGFQLMTS